jgi:hypothetical protein
VDPCHSLISIHIRKCFHIPKLKFFTPFSKILLCWLYVMHWYYFPQFIQIFAAWSTVMEFCRQQCKRTEMENSWGANFQCNYQQMSLQNACITLPMNEGPHGKEHDFHMWINNSTKIEHLFVGKVKITPFNGSVFFNGSRPFLCVSCLSRLRPLCSGVPSAG